MKKIQTTLNFASMKYLMIRTGFAVMLGMMVYLMACQHKSEPVTVVPDKVCFTEEVLPIFVTYCAQEGCHSPNTASNGYILDNYNDIISKGLVPFKPEASEIYQVLVTNEQDERMPQFPQLPLSGAQITTIRNWILQGATNDSCEVECDTVNVTYSKQVTTLMKKHCLGCHTGAGSSSGIDLSTYATLKTYVDNGKLYKSVNHEVGAVPMPFQGDKLPDCKVRAFKIWIDNGAPNN